MKTILPRRLTTKFAWGFNWEANLPYAYIFPNAKKQFTTARPVISFYKSPLSKILKAVANVLFIVIKVAFKDNLHTDDVFKTFCKLNAFLGKMQIPENCEIHNDDLVGFYISVPHDRIKKALNHMLEKYLATQPPPPGKTAKDIMCTVELERDCTKIRVIRGKVRKPTRTQYTINFTDINDLVDMSLQFSFFTIMNKVYYQKRGFCIGSPISPTLCNITVSYDEHMWLKTHNIQLQSKDLLFTRCVGNRICILDKKQAQTK